MASKFKKLFAKKNWLMTAVILVLLVVSGITHYLFINHPKKLKSMYQISLFERAKTLKQIQDYLLGNDLKIRVIKRQFKKTIYLDFFSEDGPENWKRISTVKLKGSKDGFFQYWNDPVSLGLIDENGDGILEIIAPTFNDMLIPYINIVFYNQKTKKFELKDSPLSLPQAL